tara:strand:+ start:19001 stop:19216 length:216 start_codon:yes stop_codon:yes gene_type:complete
MVKKEKYYNPDYKKYYDSAEEYVKSLDKESIEVSLSHDYINEGKEVMEVIKKLYSDLYKKYPAHFKRILKK